MTTGALSVHQREDVAGRVLLRLTGELDLSNVARLSGAVHQVVGNDASGLVLDLTRLTYLDSVGISMLFRLFRELGDRQQDLQLVVPAGSLLRRVLELGGVLAVVPTVDQLPDRDDPPTKLPVASVAGAADNGGEAT